jgi:hypothetical protein
LIDTYTAFAASSGWAVPGYTVDGTHPSATGFAAIKSLYDDAVGNTVLPLNISWNAGLTQPVLTNQNHSISNLQFQTGLSAAITNVGTAPINVTCSETWAFEVTPGGGKGSQVYVLEPGTHAVFGNSSITDDEIWRRIG